MSNERRCQCGQAHGACTTEFQYAVKLVFGEVSAVPEGDFPKLVAPGRYWTAINIHNPDKCKDAHFRAKLAVAYPHPFGSGSISEYLGLRPLRPDAAMEIDSMRLVLTLFPAASPKFVKGYVVIESEIELDVVAVYTGAQTADGPLTTFHTERVQPRCVPVCEDLVLPLHTGFAAWRTVSPEPLGPVVPVTQAAWGAPPFGSSWVSQTGADGKSASLIERAYEMCFDLCSGFEVPAPFQIQLLADDSAMVLLNNQQVGAIVSFNAPTTLTVDPNLLHVGRNCFLVKVTNGPPPAGGPTGFALAGILRVVRGKCPCAPLPIAAP